MRKPIIILLLLMSIFLVSCSKKNEYKKNLNEVKLVDVKDVVKTKSGYTFLNENEDLLDKINSFSALLTYEFIQSATDNSVISPLSVYMALALTYEALDSGAKEELLNALKVTENDLKKTRELIETLTMNYAYGDGLNKKEVSRLTLTNSLWFDMDNGLEYNKEVLKRMADDYYCHIMQAPFNTDNKKANQILRDFVKDETNGLIDRDFAISNDVLALIVNTLYLKDMWSDEGFLSTEGRDFNGHKQDFLIGNYFNGKTYIDRKYSSFYTKTYSGFKIHFILPNEGQDIKEIMTSSTIYNTINRQYEVVNEELMEQYHTRVIFPKFNASGDVDLKKILEEKFGVRKLFSGFLSPLTDSELYISGINHKAELKVDEKGIEGAAVTYIPMCGSAAPVYRDVYYDFIVDRTFGFVVTTSDNVILFSGVVSK